MGGAGGWRVVWICRMGVVLVKNVDWWKYLFSYEEMVMSGDASVMLFLCLVYAPL